VKEHQSKNLAIFTSFLGYAIFGFSFLFSKQALNTATPFVLFAVRFTVAFLLLNCLLVFRVCRLMLKGKRIGLVLLLGLIQPVMYFICENYGVKLSATSFVGTILALIPVASLIAARVFLKEKIRIFQAACFLVSVGGVFLTTLHQSSGSFSWLGFILLLIAVCIGAMFNVLSRKISVQFSAFERTYVMFALGSAVFTCIALVQCAGNLREMVIVPLSDREFWISIVYLAGLSSVGAFLMLNYSVTHLDIASASIFANITTVITILAGVLILHESFGIFQIIGSAVIILAAYGVNAKHKGDLEGQEKHCDQIIAD
jgi:drug/metabolite transporter (DMT)-like permease